MRLFARLLPLAIAAASLVGCGDDADGSGSTGGDAGSGTITFTSWGEEYIEQGIPSSEFADGWGVTYQRFLILIGDIHVADAEGQVAAEKPNFVLVDHVAPGPKPIASFDGVEAKAWTHVSYQTSPVADASQIELGPGATDADVQSMVSGGCHVYAEGTLSNGTDSKTFAWCLGVPTLLDACEGEVDGKLTEGVVVTEGGNDQVELTVHGDHLFYDDLQSASAVLRAQAIADADADDDGEVTLDELAAVDIDDLPPDSYGLGSTTGVANLRDYVAFLSRTLGHFRGEGECFVKDP
jgi:hypothetical protein